MHVWHSLICECFRVLCECFHHIVHRRSTEYLAVGVCDTRPSYYLSGQVDLNNPRHVAQSPAPTLEQQAQQQLLLTSDVSPASVSSTSQQGLADTVCSGSGSSSTQRPLAVCSWLPAETCQGLPQQEQQFYDNISMVSMLACSSPQHDCLHVQHRTWCTTRQVQGLLLCCSDILSICCRW